MKLYEIPKGSKLRIEFTDGWHDCIFHHLDGAYSYCTVEDYPKGSKAFPIFHLSVNTPLRKEEDIYFIEESNQLSK